MNTQELILDKVKNILDDEEVIESRLKDYIATVSDRLCIRLAVDTLPDNFISIAADAVIKMHRRFYYEGVASEGDGTVSTSFVNDILSEYSDEINAYIKKQKGAVHFL